MGCAPSGCEDGRVRHLRPGAVPERRGIRHRPVHAGQRRRADGCLRRAYNDYLVDYSSVDPWRFIPIAAVPFWDIELRLSRRSARRRDRPQGNHASGRAGAMGPAATHLPALGPDLGRVPGPRLFRSTSTSRRATSPTCAVLHPEHGERASFASFGVSFFLGNAATISSLIFGGVCHRFPRLQLRLGRERRRLDAVRPRLDWTGSGRTVR